MKLEFVRQVITSRLLLYRGAAGEAARSLGIHRNTLTRLMDICEVNLKEIKKRVEIEVLAERYAARRNKQL